MVDDEDETKIAGLVSLRDVFRGSLARTLGYGTRAQQKLLDMLVVKEGMTTELVTPSPTCRSPRRPA